MKIRKEDQILVISGKYRGKKGKVVKSLPKEGKVVVGRAVASPGWTTCWRGGRCVDRPERGSRRCRYCRDRP